MRLAVNYSTALADLVAHGEVKLDLYKAPAWPDLIKKIDGAGPVYIHFPLRAGMGTGTPVNTETGEAPDWDAFETMMASTGTPWMSAHMGPQPDDHPALAAAPWARQVTVITDALIRDMGALVARFGPDRVVGENIFEYFGMHLRPAVMPEVLTEVVETTGCGLLLDLSHARLAARDLDVDARAYVEALPVSRLRELHITGIQRFEGKWIRLVQANGVAQETIEGWRGRWLDHLPMTDEDWTFFEWALGRIRDGAWPTPEIIAFEYGGVGAEFEAITVREELAVQVPRLYAMVHANTEASKDYADVTD
ncbi:MAG: DUF692 family protein [Anaerolineae bacterium]|nr:DUF692 family protein [Anaerolineae bacterium]